MNALYPALRDIHIASAFLSVGLFVIRHVLNLRRVDWQKSRALKIGPHIVDTILLLSAVALCIEIHQYPFVTAWLTVKVIALVAYIILGTVALKRGRTQAIRRVSFLAAVAIFAFIVSVARTHSPLGILSQF